MLIASYPRSGSTWLRFILCHIYYPNVDHTFETVDHHIPAIDSLMGMRAAIPNPIFYKTHSLRHGNLVIFLHRHVGDVVISEWWYKRKYFGDQEPRSLEEYLEADDYGAGWRAHVDHYFPSERMIPYEWLDKPHQIEWLLNACFPTIEAPCSWTIEAIERAIDKSSFGILQKTEDEHGTGLHSVGGDPSIRFMRRGESDQWKGLPEDIQNKIIEKNYIQLKALGYVA